MDHKDLTSCWTTFWTQEVVTMLTLLQHPCTLMNHLAKLSLPNIYSYDHIVCQNFNYRPQRSCEGYVFTPACHSVHGWGVSASGYHPPGSRHPPREQAGIPPETRHPPPSRRLLLRTVRILLECILVKHIFKTTRLLKDCICSGLLTPPSHTAMERVFWAMSCITKKQVVS